MAIGIRLYSKCHYHQQTGTRKVTVNTSLRFCLRTHLPHMLAFCLVLAGCGGSRNPVDKFLDQYEENVSAWKNKGSKISIDDINEINKANIDFAKSAKELQAAGQWSDSQLKRYSDITTSFSKVLLELSKNPPDISF